MASVQGGWRPWWQQGSRVTYMVAPAGSWVQAARAARSAWRSPHLAWYPWPMTWPSLTITAPTMGLGLVHPAPFWARERAWAIYSWSVIVTPHNAKSALKQTFRARQNKHRYPVSFPMKKLWNDTIPEHTSTENRRGDPAYCLPIFFHPDYTVGFGIAPNPAVAGSRTVPPIGNFTLP